MAKKKSKSSKNMVNLLVGAIGLLFGVAALCMGFLSGATFNGGDYEMTTVFQMAFGWKESVIGDSSISLSGFNIWITLGLFFPIIGGLLLLLKGKFSALIALVLYVVAAVLFFTALSSFTNTLFTMDAVLDNPIGAAAAEAIRALIKNGNASLGVGAILGGIFSILGALVAAYKTFFLKK